MTNKFNAVSLVVTSCGRVDLLQRTIDSFLRHNTYPIVQSILIEDSCDASVHERVLSTLGATFDLILFNESKLGQIKSIDRAYSYVESNYIFHCEDDWYFTRPGFIEDSLSILEQNDDSVTVWLRDRKEFAAGRISSHRHATGQGVAYRDINAEADPDWHGFTFNPGLRRLADYKRIAPFAHIGHEYEINKRYYELGYHAAILEQPATRHTGWQRSVRKQQLGKQLRKPRTWLQKRLGLNKCNPKN